MILFLPCNTPTTRLPSMNHNHQRKTNNDTDQLIILHSRLIINVEFHCWPCIVATSSGLRRELYLYVGSLVYSPCGVFVKWKIWHAIGFWKRESKRKHTSVYLQYNSVISEITDDRRLLREVTMRTAICLLLLAFIVRLMYYLISL